MKKKIFSILLSLSFLVANLSTTIGAVNVSSPVTLTVNADGIEIGIAPGATIFVTPGYENQRGAFNTLNWDVETWFGFVTKENTYTIGGWF